MNFRLTTVQKTCAALFLATWAVGAWRSGDVRRPDLGHVVQVGKQAVQQSTAGAIALGTEARRWVGAKEAEASDAPPAPNPIAPNLPINPMEGAIAPSEPIASTGVLSRQLGCNPPVLSAVQPLNPQTFTAWLSRLGGYPKPTLASLQTPLSNVATPSACVSTDRTQAVWLLMLGPTPQRLVVRLNPTTLEYAGHELAPLLP